MLMVRTNLKKADEAIEIFGAELKTLKSNRRFKIANKRWCPDSCNFKW